MTITFSSVKSAVKRHLSIIGKRMYTKEGQNMFSNITTSTAEDPIFDQYISAAAEGIEAMLRQLVTSFSLTSSQFSITIANTRGSSDFDTRCNELVTSYVTLFTVGEYLSMTHPDLAEKYRQNAAGAMHSLLTYAFFKNPPKQAASDPLSITTNIS